MQNFTCDRVFDFRTSLSSLIKVTDWLPRWRFSQREHTTFLINNRLIFGWKENYGKAISSFPFLWLYFIIRIYEYDIKVKLFFLSRQVHIGTKYTWKYRRLCQLIAGRSHLSIFNRESRWLLVCRILYLYLWLLVLRGHPILHVPMLNPWLTTRLCFTTSSSSAIFIYDYLILQPKENLMSCCRGALF